MLKRIGRPLGLGIVLGFLMLCVTCGSEEGKKPKEREDGRIFLRNETNVTMDVSYVHKDLGQIDTVVEAGEEKEISQALLKGGTQVIVHVQARTNMAAVAEIPITVDGRRVIRITALGVWGTGTLEYEIQ